MDIMLLCFNSIKVKVFYALECCNTASPEKKNYLKKMDIVGLSGPESNPCCMLLRSSFNRTWAESHESRIVWPLHHPCVVSQCPVWSSPLMSLHAGAGSVSHEFVVVVVLDGQAAMEQRNIVQQLQTFIATNDCHK